MLVEQLYIITGYPHEKECEIFAMPIKDGFTLAKEIRKENTSIPIIGFFL